MMPIGEVARLVGVRASAIRYYESQGIVRPAARGLNGYRFYREQAVHILAFVSSSLGGAMSAFAISFSLGLFVLAGLCEIGGGWMVWQWLRESKPWTWGLLGSVLLVLYGVIPIFQTTHFGRVYATYGGFFIVLSLLWGWVLDGNKPDRLDLIGGAVSLTGVAIMMYWPR
jgi:small multidrug resistance family-3 protein